MQSRAFCARRIAVVVAALVGGALTACSESQNTASRPTGPAGDRTHGQPTDAGQSTPPMQPPFDWALDGTACTNWPPYWDVHGMADHDGDGVQAEWAQRCTDGRVQTIFRPDLATGRNDCDDSDPTRSIAAWRDGDGDGFAPLLIWEACFAVVPPGYTHSLASVAVADCDDADPLLQEILYVDEDGDGFGVKDEPRCAPFVPYDQSSPPGLTRNTKDCDDHDPGRHPYALELWNDGVDSNCNGKDQPLECTTNPPTCGCALLTTAPPVIDPSCAAADLFVVAQVGCVSCFGYNVVVIGNRGTATARGGFDLAVTDRDGWKGTLSVLADLAPGEKTDPILLETGVGQVEIVTSAVECDATNNVATLRAFGVPCE